MLTRVVTSHSSLLHLQQRSQAEVVVLIIRFIIAFALMLIAIFGYVGLPGTNVAAHSISTRTIALLLGMAAAILLYSFIDLIIGVHASWYPPKLIPIPKYRMENKRLLSSSLIVTSGVIIGLTKTRSPLLQLDTALLAAGILFGFINLSVHGGSVHEEIDKKRTTSDKRREQTIKLTMVEEFHDKISTSLLNAQILMLIIGIISLR
jgi:hypothetical protein